MIFILFFIIIFAEKSQIMKKIVFLFLICMPICQVVSAQTLKKQNQMLKDSISIMHKVIDEKSSVNSALSKDNSTLKNQNVLLKASKDSLIKEQKTLLGKYKNLSEENDLLKDSLFIYRGQNKTLNLQVDSLNTKIENLTEEMNTKLDYMAKQEKIWGRKKYFNISYGMPSLTRGNGLEKLNSDFAVAINRGNTYYLHKKPLFGMLKFGLDWTVFDIAAAKYTVEESDFEDGGDIYKAEIGMQFGPSITINPVDFLKINVYFRYDPTFSVAYNQDSDFLMNYGSYFNTGLAASYKVISLGAEYRWGTTSYKIDEENQDWKVSGAYLYVSFRF